MERFRESDIVMLTDPLGGIGWIREQLATKFGLDFGRWPEEVQDFLRWEADKIFQGWCKGNLVCLNVGDRGTISTGLVGVKAHSGFVQPIVGHIPSQCYKRLRSSSFPPALVSKDDFEVGSNP